MTPAALAALQARAMPGPPRPWTAFWSRRTHPTLRRLPTGASGTSRLSALMHAPGDAAVLVARRAGPEAEVLTLFTAPERRREGHARRLLAALDRWAAGRGVAEIFLEVAETNAPARALYAAAGYAEQGFRKDYYATPRGPRVHARVMAKRVASG